MKNYKKLNNIIGWFVFLLASIVYLLTIEPTVSWWDCGEFIATSYKLEIGHPPGNPVFMLIGRFFAMLAFGDVTKIAMMANVKSALASAFTVMFLFWTITALAKKILIKKDEPLDITKAIILFGSGFVGAMGFAFTDSFWFSAVEGVVFPSSAVFTAIAFWAIIKWEAVADNKQSDRWIIFIALMIGLSMGIHLLNLLTIPALGFVVYFKKYKASAKGVIITLLLSFAILLFVLYGIIPGSVQIAAQFELLFTNGMGFPFGTGFTVFVLLVVGLITFGIYYANKKRKRILSISMLCLTMIMLGYSSYALIVIRSKANTPINENGPDNLFSLLSYINREQYGDRPLFYGQYYNAKYIDNKEGAMNYIPGDKKYEPVGRKVIPVYEPQNCGMFPRMYSSEENHIFAYKMWAGITGDRKPTFGENLKFFWSYQIDHMYWRYFLWNFVGRQNDLQGDGYDYYGNKDILNGNWYSGFPFIDEPRLGPQSNLPESIKWNKGRNRFYFLPLILGFIGLIYHFRKSRKDVFVVLVLFFLTGLAIILYTNQTPYQPRERDYAYCGSFYAFAIWIGFSVAGLYQMISKWWKGIIPATAITLICCFCAPYILARDGWDDHDRSHKTSARDFAENYLQSCAPNAILFTNGDNDTFPLWYLQEVEGIRTDVRVVNLTLLSGGWYVHQMFSKAYQSDPLPLTLSYKQYNEGTNDYVPVYDQKIQGYTDLQDILQFIGSSDENTKLMTEDGKRMNYIPTKKLSLKVDTDLVRKNGTVPQSMMNRVVPVIEWTMSRGSLYKNDLMLLDFLANNHWKRPVYFVSPSSVRGVIDLEKYCYLEGYAYRFIPVKPRNENAKDPGINIDRCYDVLMNKCKWGGLDRGDIYVDGETYRMAMQTRNTFARLSETLYNEGKKDSAITVLDKSLAVIPEKTVPYTYYMLPYVQLYYIAKATKKANALAQRLAAVYDDDLRYYSSFGSQYSGAVEQEKEEAIKLLQNLSKICAGYKQFDVSGKIDRMLAKYNIKPT